MALRRHFAESGLIPGGFIASVRFVPAATQANVVISEQWGVKSVTRDGTGAYTIAVFGKVKGMTAVVMGQENDTTTFHFCRVESQSDTAGTVTISHKSVAFASVASGPTASDTIDAIVVHIYCRTQ